MNKLTDRARFEVDLELPQEAWAVEDLDEETACLFRLIFLCGYIKATRDAKSGKIGSLITRVGRLQNESRIGVEGPG